MVATVQGFLVALVIFNLGLTYHMSSKLSRHLGAVENKTRKHNGD